MQISRLAGALGAELNGMDLSGDLSDADIDAIRAALLDHQVIFFRDQNITPAQQLALAKRFGDIHLHPYIRGLDEYPEIIEIIKTETDTRNFGGVWHTDQMFNRRPAMATMLYAHETPATGGDTMFASMYAAYDALSPGMQDLASRIKTYNSGDKFKSSGGKSRQETMQGRTSMVVKAPDPGQDTEAEHPLVRTHPETGKKALYIGSHSQRFANMTDAESEPLLTYLYEHSVRPEFTCRFHWAPGSLAIWDNRCTQHLAIDDYQGQRRRMHRITIAGDVPA